MLVLIALLQTASADCMSGSLSVLPMGGSTLSTTPEVILQAYGTERPRIDALEDVALVNGDTRVPLKRSKVLRGSFTDDQHVFVPTQPLEPGTWSLSVGGETHTGWNGSAWTSTEWQVAEALVEPPGWIGAPKLVDSRRDYFGCGPGVSVNIAVPVRGAQLVEAIVVDAADKAVTVRLAVEDGRITLGHGMCSGLLDLQEGQSYTATFAAVGPANQTAVPHRTAVRFTAP